MSDRLPSGSTTSNNSVPRRLTVDITINERPSNGCRSRRIVTEREMSWRWVVCGNFLRYGEPGLARPFPGTPDRRPAGDPSDPEMAEDGRSRRRRGAGQWQGNGTRLGDLAVACQYLPALRTRSLGRA